MFKKPFKVKSNSQLKGSDRKKLRSDILQQFPSLTENTLSLILPNKETIFQLKLITHGGDIVVVYTVQKLPIMFEMEKVMYPTIYMLWHAPDLLYTFTTHPQVFPIISGGADLMLPGVVLQGEGIHAYGRLQKGDRVAVNLTSNKAPIAVGKAANSSYDMYMCAKKGKCVQVLHYYGDQLSTYGTKLVIPELGPPNAFQSEKNNGDSEASIEEISEINLSQEEVNEESVELRLCENAEGEADSNKENGNSNNENGNSNNENDNSNKENDNTSSQVSAESMDDLLRYCFLKSLKTTMKKVELPLLTSNFYKLHMIPACPKNKTLDIKKSSYKKLSIFLEEMVKLRVIQLESPQKGVQSISKVEYSCDLIRDFVDNIENVESDAGLSIDTTSTNKSSTPEITEKYTVTAAVLPMFYNYDYNTLCKKTSAMISFVMFIRNPHISMIKLVEDEKIEFLFDLTKFYGQQDLQKKKEAVTAEVVRKVTTDYVRVRNLQNPSNRKEVNLDQTLRSATNCSADVETLPWDQLMAAVFKNMGHSFKVEMSGLEISQRGKLPPIDIQVGTRSGNKKVTLVNNLELYGINLTEFARECQLGVAASTTINTLPSAKSAQLQIQGNQVTFVAKILTEKYQIPKRYLRGTENAPKKKK